MRDRSGSGIKFNSSLLPPYLKKTKSVEELLPWLYLKGISTGEYQEALVALLGEDAKGLSPNTLSRLKSKWNEEHRQWSRRDLSDSRYVYWWADGVYSNVRMEDTLSFGDHRSDRRWHQGTGRCRGWFSGVGVTAGMSCWSALNIEASRSPPR